MNTNSKRNILTRDKLLAILNTTEETVKLGISITDVLPVFKPYKLKLRVFDVVGKMICRQDPETRNDNNKAMYCMVKGNHVYTLNYNIDLEKKMDANPEFYVKAHSDYHIGEEKREQNYKMISHIDDLIKLVKMITVEGKPTDKVVLNLMYKGDKLVELLYQLKDAGYEPSVKYEGGKLTHIELINSGKESSYFD